MHSFFRRQFLKEIVVSLATPFFLIACGGGIDASSSVIPTPKLSSVSNFRDVAIAEHGVAYRTSSGQMLRQGVLYRSNALTPSAEDLATLNTLGIHAVYDLRTPLEIAPQPDVLPDGAVYRNINIVGNDSVLPVSITSQAEAIAFIEDLNRQFVIDANQRAKFAELFTAIAASTDAQLFHCTAGKDRTGWAAAVLLSLADVPREVIFDDYMLTNTYLAATISAAYVSVLAAYGKEFADNYFPLFGVQRSFLEAGFDQVVKSYGSMNNYISDGLGLDAATQARLRDKLVQRSQ